ncbi:hypothetical protein [Sinimarinibacterium sp. NLF-5-8]|uniref:hypothetical protein n=1 Tax=Sinimarinibacterium sp. NLF-5-8 TaxID=2698684 RepID=UPI00137BADD8|nr:hypothetical protein [Sinimarinibacterium sp. NLF-5-8]QHS10861.1 hypothetical protein GT972_12395 [Sinimarinibacterium sp. NLF-5-8]
MTALRSHRHPRARRWFCAPVWVLLMLGFWLQPILSTLTHTHEWVAHGAPATPLATLSEPLQSAAAHSPEPLHFILHHLHSCAHAHATVDAHTPSVNRAPPISHPLIARISVGPDAPRARHLKPPIA